MLAQLRSRLGGRNPELEATGEEGFTLIELMVVVLIIAILIAIAIPTFLGARQKAQDRAAQSNLRNALTAAKTAYVDSQSYASDITAGVYASIEPSLVFVTSGGATTGANAVSVAADSNGGLFLAGHAASGSCFYVWDQPTAAGAVAAGTKFGKGPDSSGACSATTVSTGTAPTSGWNNTW